MPPHLVPLDALAFALLLLSVVIGTRLPLPVGLFPVFACWGMAFTLLIVAKR